MNFSFPHPRRRAGVFQVRRLKVRTVRTRCARYRLRRGGWISECGFRSAECGVRNAKVCARLVAPHGMAGVGGVHWRHTPVRRHVAGCEISGRARTGLSARPAGPGNPVGIGPIHGAILHERGGQRLSKHHLFLNHRTGDRQQTGWTRIQAHKAQTKRTTSRVGRGEGLA
jgi:hypothetical protein